MPKSKKGGAKSGKSKKDADDDFSLEEDFKEFDDEDDDLFGDKEDSFDDDF
jgi:hypothetical protein